MKNLRYVSLVLIPLLFACAPVKPEVPRFEVPAAPILQALELHRQSFRSLKAIASVRAMRRGRRYALDSVGIVIKSREKLRIEAYTPLGHPLIELVWAGNDVFIRQDDKVSRRKPGEGLKRYFGADLEPSELCAVLTGNIPELPNPADSRAFCGEDGCILELGRGNSRWKVWVERYAAGADIRLASLELYRAGSAVFRARFEEIESVSDYLLPKKVSIEGSDGKTGLTVHYEDVEVNTPVGDGAFVLSGTGVPE